MADLEPGLRTTPRGFVGSCGVTVAENYGVKKIRGGLRDIYLVQITSARQQVVKPDQQIGYQGNGVWSVTE